MTYTLQILHASDLEGGVDAIANAPNFAAIVDELEGRTADFDGSVLISAGDNYIPGPFFGAAGDRSLRDVFQSVYQQFYGEPGLTNIREDAGRADITIANILGFDASAVGNHEFDAGPNVFGGLIEPDVRGPDLDDIRWPGAQFPYLSANLDYSGDDDLAPLFDDVLREASDYGSTPAEYAAGTDLPQQLAPSTVIDVDGMPIGVIGATTQRLTSISSTGDVVGTAGNVDDMAALAAELQPEIDRLANGLDGVAGTADDIDKIILTSHLQDFNLEAELATLLTGVDVILAGGSDTRSADPQDTLRPGDTADQPYPLIVTGADGNPTAVVSTDGEYSYVGRLVIEFDEDGVIIPASVDENVSGAFATDEAGVLATTGAADLDTAIADSDKASQIDELTSALQDVITAADGDIAGETDVYIEGRREFVRTEETTLGNLSSDANIFAANEAGEDVLISIKNGGGIRAAIGSVDGITGELLPTAANDDAMKAEGDISSLDIQNALRFNNTLATGTLTPDELKIVLEHAVAETAPGATPGQFPQIGGFQFSFDPNGTAQVLDDDANVVTEGTRVKDIALLNPDGTTGQHIFIDGELAEGAPAGIRTVTLNFLAGAFSPPGAALGGDNYPFPAFMEDLTFTGIGEQQALTDFLAANFPNDDSPDNNFDAVETAPILDTRIQNLDERSSSIGSNEVEVTVFEEFDSGSGGDGAEVVAREGDRLFVTNGEEDRIDIFGLDGADDAPGAIPLDGLPGYDGVQSVAVKNGIIAVAVDSPDVAAPLGLPGTVGGNGFVAFFDADTGALLNTVEVGNLPDQLVFSADGQTLLVANEGQKNEDEETTNDPVGSISKIDLTNGVENAVATTVGFEMLDGFEDALRDLGVRIAPGKTVSQDVEPEYIAISPDGTTAFVTLQENNAVARLDLFTMEIDAILPLGTIDRSVKGNELDPLDDGEINLGTFDNLVGMRMPDAIVAFQLDGETFFATANEGDSRGDPTDLDEGDMPMGQDEARVGDILDGDVAGVSIDESVDTTGLERLQVSTIDGDTDGDGDIDVLHHFGSRSFTIFDADGDLVFDSGSEFEQIIASIAPERFNNDDGDPIGTPEDPGDPEDIFVDNRSDAKGPEPEAIEFGQIGDESYLFIGLERDSGIMIYNVTEPEASRFVGYIPGYDGPGTLEHVSPEIIEFIPAGDSPSGNAMIAVSYEVSGTTAVYEIAQFFGTPNSAPVFDNLPDTAVLDADTATTREAFDVDATDGEGDEITFSLGGEDAGLATIDEDTGVVIFNSDLGDLPFSADGDGIFEFEVTATDSFGNGRSSDLEVQVDNLGSGAPGAPVFDNLPMTSDEMPLELDTAATPRARLVLDLDATDPDGGTVRYEISGEDAAFFQMAPTTGELFARTVYSVMDRLPDADGDGVFEFQVTATDDQGASTTEDLFIDFV